MACTKSLATFSIYLSLKIGWKKALSLRGGLFLKLEILSQATLHIFSHSALNVATLLYKALIGDSQI